MSELSAAALAVEKDRLLEGGRTPAEVERMQRAVVLTDVDLWNAVREAARVYGAREGLADYAMDVIDGAIQVMKSNSRTLLPPTEKPQGVHAPQPQAPSTEPRRANGEVCLTCRARGLTECTMGPDVAQPSACPPPSVSSEQKQSTEVPSSLETEALSQSRDSVPQ